MEETIKVHPLAGYWLTRSAKLDEALDPFRSVMDLTEEEALERGLHERIVGNGSYSDYRHYRTKVEGWAKGEAEALGVKIDNEHPVYFTLRENPMGGVPPEGYVLINIPVSEVPEESISMMFGDSFNNYGKIVNKEFSDSPNLVSGEVYSSASMGEFLQKNGFPEGMDRATKSAYIECQLWSRDLAVLNTVKEALLSGERQNVTLDNLAHKSECAMLNALRTFNKEHGGMVEQIKQLQEMSGATAIVNNKPIVQKLR